MTALTRCSRHESGVEWWTPRSPAVASWDPAVVAFGEESWPNPVSSALHFHTPISVRWLNMVERRIRSRPSDKQLCNNVQQNTQDTRQEQSPSTVAESAVLTWNIGDWHVCSKSAAAQCDHRYDYGAREGERSELQSNFVPNLWNSIAWVPPVPTGAQCPDGQGWRNFLWSRLGFPLEPLKLCMKLHEHI